MFNKALKKLKKKYLIPNTFFTVQFFPINSRRIGTKHYSNINPYLILISILLHDRLKKLFQPTSLVFHLAYCAFVQLYLGCNISGKSPLFLMALINQCHRQDNSAFCVNRFKKFTDKSQSTLRNCNIHLEVVRLALAIARVWTLEKYIKEMGSKVGTISISTV